MPEWTDPRYADLVKAWRREQQLCRPPTEHPGADREVIFHANGGP
ncbi:hypothetical protein [Streptomyces sp. NPDC096032]